MGDHLHIGFRLNEFIVRPVKNSIEGPAGVQHVSARAMEVLLALARKPGWVLTRGQLREQVWGDTEVSATVVTRSVGELRQVLGDKGGSPRFIQTISGRGYRLIPDPLPLAEVIAETASSPHQPAPVDEQASTLFGFITDLAHRKVYRVAASYLVASWVLLQVADVILDALPLPAYSMTFLVVALAMGFPVAVVLAWAFQWTPQGLMVEGFGGRLRGFSAGSKPAALVYVVAAVSALLIGSGAYMLTASDQTTDLPLPAAESIAVLPFVNFSDNPANEYFSDGLTEEVLNVLAQMGNLQVASRTSSFYFKGKDLDIKDIARSLNVRYLLEGSVRLAGNDMRITAQLIDGENGYHLWSGAYDRKTEDVFAVQSDIARQVARNLKVVLTSNLENALEQVPTKNLEAYDTYLRGRDYLRRPRTNENLANAVNQFQQATVLDPAFGMAYAGTCEARLGQYELNADSSLFELAEKACNRAMTRDANSAEVVLALGDLHLLSGQVNEAMEEIDRALAQKPRWVHARLSRASALIASGLFGEAEQEMKFAIEIDPGYWDAYQRLGNFYFNRGRFEEAIANYQEVVKRTPDNASAYNNLASAYYLKGDFQNASEIWLKAVAIVPSAPMYYNIGSMYYYLRRFDDAVRMYHKAIELAPDEFLTWGGLGEAYRQIPDAWNQAEAAYRKAFQLGEAMLAINPDDVDVMNNLAPFYAGIGDFDKAFTLLEAAHSKSSEDMYYFYNAALINVRAGDPVKAEDALMRAVELGYPVSLLSMDASLDPLQGRLRFEALEDSGK
ncbi:MAG: tetratricopeptide repeat protein [Gammaproteobacteria bacterium]|nr:tetratricopeptide repeat protein [Gammaproteobacteria bacterium]